VVITPAQLAVSNDNLNFTTTIKATNPGFMLTVRWESRSTTEICTSRT